jgi:hypothetical protein
MIWERSETIALAKATCTHCHGYGLRPGRQDREVACNCVYRAIFRACYARFRDLATQEKHMSRVCLEFGHRTEGRMTYGRKNEEYLADFYLISRRTLNTAEFDVFRYHFTLGANWKLCCWRLKIDRGTFFHTVYRIEQKLGRIFRELEPYGLYPLDEYFHGVICKALPGSAREAAVLESPVVPISCTVAAEVSLPLSA